MTLVGFSVNVEFWRDLTGFGYKFGAININGDSIQLASSQLGQLMRYDGDKWINWTPDFDTHYNIDTVYMRDDTLFIEQNGDTTFTEITIDTSQVENLSSFINAITDSLSNIYTDGQVDYLLGEKADTSLVMPQIRQFNKDSTKYIQDLSRTISGTYRTINISNGASTGFTIADNDSLTNNETNTSVSWTDATNTLSVVDAAGTQSAVITGFLESEVDGSVSNEIQDLSGSGSTLSGYTLSLSSDASTVTLPNEIDPKFAIDSSYIKSAVRQYVKDSAKYVLSTDITGMIDGSGTANFVPKFSDANTLTNSVFKDDGTIATIEQNNVQPFTSVLSGAVDNTLYLKEGKVGILTTTPLHPIDIRGNAMVSGDFILSNISGLIASSTNAKRIIITGGASATSTAGSYITLEGYDYGGTGLGGNITIRPTTNHSTIIGVGKTGFLTTSPDQTVDINCGTTGGLQLSYNDADGSAVNKVVYGVTSSGDATVTPSGGDVELTTSNLKLQSTTNSSPYGVIYKGATPFIHDFNYGNNGTVTTVGRNTFIGINAGNLSLGTTATNDYQSSSNTGCGYGSLSYITTAYRTTALGYYSGTFTILGANLLNPIESVFIGGNTRSKADGSQNEIVVGFSAYGNGSNTVTIGNSSITDNYFNGNLISGKIKTTQITAALTDNTPTDAEIDAATSLTPSTAGAGWQCTIKDNNGSGLLYKIESDGTDWYYIALTKAL